MSSVKYLLVALSFLVAPIFSVASDPVPQASSFCGEDAVAYRRGQCLILRSALGAAKMRLEDKKHPLEGTELKAYQNYARFLENELEIAVAKLKALAQQLGVEFCRSTNVVSPQAKAMLLEFEKFAHQPHAPWVQKKDYLETVGKIFLEHGDEHVYGVFNGIWEGLKKAGLEVVNFTVDAETVALFGLFDPESGQYYELRSGLAKSLEKMVLRKRRGPSPLASIRRRSSMG